MLPGYPSQNWPSRLGDHLFIRAVGFFVLSAMLFHRVKRSLCSLFSELALLPESVCVYVEKSWPGTQAYPVTFLREESCDLSCKRSLRFVKTEVTRGGGWPGTTFSHILKQGLSMPSFSKIVPSETEWRAFVNQKNRRLYYGGTRRLSFYTNF